MSAISTMGRFTWSLSIPLAPARINQSSKSSTPSVRRRFLRRATMTSLIAVKQQKPGYDLFRTSGHGEGMLNVGILIFFGGEVNYCVNSPVFSKKQTSGRLLTLLLVVVVVVIRK